MSIATIMLENFNIQETKTNSNTDRIIDVSQSVVYEKVSKTPIVLELPINENIDDYENSYSWKLIELVDSSRGMVEFFVWRYHPARYCFLIMSLLFGLIHFFLQCYLMFHLIGVTQLGISFGFINSILGFIIAQIFLARTMFNKKEKSSCLSTIYTLAAILYLLFGILYIQEVSFNKYYYVTIIFLMGIALNLYGLYIIFSVLIIIFLFGIFLIENFVRFIICNVFATIKGTISYNIYSYKSGKTAVTQCMICLSEYKDNDEICIAKCHKLHIFHQQCITSWLLYNPTCPVCRSSNGFM